MKGSIYIQWNITWQQKGSMMGSITWMNLKYMLSKGRHKKPHCVVYEYEMTRIGKSVETQSILVAMGGIGGGGGHDSRHDALCSNENVLKLIVMMVVFF